MDSPVDENNQQPQTFPLEPPTETTRSLRKRSSKPRYTTKRKKAEG